MDKKELTKQFNVLIEDLLDNYDKYTDEEKAQVKELFNKAAELNAVLDKYDVEHKFDWKGYFVSLGQYLDNYYH
ncbi:MAG: hypothetical protein IKU99_01490 [Clostridia bacterium]|nr:hypothetical protein [Clostridia bacterium]